MALIEVNQTIHILNIETIGLLYTNYLPNAINM